MVRANNLAWLALVFTLIVAGLLVPVAESVAAEQYSGGRRSSQFYRSLGAVLDHDGGTLAIAHNAGTHRRAMQQALDYGAGVIEIDVVSQGGRLYAAHEPPESEFERLAWRLAGPPKLAQAWTAAAAAAAIELDLKQSSPRLVALVIDFLAARQDGRPVLLASADPAVLHTFAERAPTVVRLLSVGDQSSLTALENDPALAAIVDGVTIRATLLDAATMTRLRSHGWLVLAWTVNDRDRLETLLTLGVDAVATDNLAIVELLARHRSAEPSLLSPWLTSRASTFRE